MILSKILFTQITVKYHYLATKRPIQIPPCKEKIRFIFKSACTSFTKLIFEYSLVIIIPIPIPKKYHQRVS